jgi:hypothetical protein
MEIRELDLEEFDGYESPNDSEELESESNYMFEMHGYSEGIDMAFITHTRGIGIDLEAALENAYNKINNKFELKYHICITDLYADKLYKLEPDDKDKGSGNTFYPLTDEVRDTFKQHHEDSKIV